jgi:spermidine/putrescine transport system permease protein
VSGTTNTFPIWVWGIQKNALPAQVNVIGSIVFLSAVGLVALSTIRTGRVPR